MQPKVLVVTLACGEAELELSIASVASQCSVQSTHVFINDLPEIEAHNHLLSMFESCKDDYDLYVKVDADTVIDHNNAFSVVHDELIRTDAAAAQLYLFDYFTCTNINGLNFYLPKNNSFRQSSDKLYCDRSIVHHGIVLYSDSFISSNIIPVGRHCVMPSKRQAFHFGFHRGLKNRVQEGALVAAAVAKFPNDHIRRYAALGFEMATSHKSMQHEYASSDFEALFNNAQMKLEGK